MKVLAFPPALVCGSSRSAFAPGIHKCEPGDAAYQKQGDQRWPD